MKKIHYLALASLTMLIISCSGSSDFVPTFKCDMGGKGDWINCKTLGKFGGADDDYCSKVDSVNEYSFGFSKLVSEISPDPVTRVKISVWVKMEHLNKKSMLVVSLSQKDKSIFWEGHELNQVVKEANKWYKFDVEDVFPSGYDIEGTNVGIYVWNPNKNVVYIDNYDIRFPKE